jgi:hypothetical protein
MGERLAGSVATPRYKLAARLSDKPPSSRELVGMHEPLARRIDAAAGELEGTRGGCSKTSGLAAALEPSPASGLRRVVLVAAGAPSGGETVLIGVSVVGLLGRAAKLLARLALCETALQRDTAKYSGEARQC